MRYEVYEGAKGMKSMTVNESEVFLVKLTPGEKIFGPCGQTPLFTAPKDKCAVVIADRVRRILGKYLLATNIRQSVICDSPDPWEYNGGWMWYPDPELRRICADRGAKRITVAAGIRPLVPVTKVFIPDYFENGTSYFEIPAKIVKELRPIEFKAYCA